MRRSTAALILLALLSLTAAACGGAPSHQMTLTLQTQQRSGDWTTNHTAHVDCRMGTADGVVGPVSALQLCDEVMHYSRYHPKAPCQPIGYIGQVTRVLIAGDDVRATLPTVVCNPPGSVAAAVQTIHTALGG